MFLLAVCNTLFSTSFGTGFIEQEVEKRINLPCEIGSVTWSPWAGVNLRELCIFEPGGVDKDRCILKVDGVKVDPSWLSLFQGKQRFESVSVSGILGELSLEQFKEWLRRYQQSHPPKLVESAENHSLQGAGVVPPRSTEVAPKAVSESPESAKNTVSAKEQREDPPVSVPVENFMGTVLLEDMNLRLYSEENPDFEISLRDVAAEIPLWGEDREGRVKLGSLAFGKYDSEIEKVFPLKWSGESVFFPRAEMKVFGVDIELTGELGLAQGLPLGVKFHLPVQQMDGSPIFSDEKTPFEVGQLSSTSYVQGHLKNLGNFSGRSVTQFRDFIFHDSRDGGDVRFSHGSAVMTLNSAGVVMNDFRAIGEEDAVLANGYVMSSGEVASTLRLVASPLRADSHEKRIRSMSPSLSFKFAPLVTPDREYRDLRVESRPEGLVVDLGAEGEWVTLRPLIEEVLGRSKKLERVLR